MKLQHYANVNFQESYGTILYLLHNNKKAKSHISGHIDDIFLILAYLLFQVGRN